MKEIMKPCTLMMMLIGFYFSFSAQAVTYNWNQPSGTISVLGNSYVDMMNNTWNLNVQEARPVRINYTIDVENTYDKVKIFAVNADSTTTTLVATLTGSTSGTISTAIPTGKAKVEFTSDGTVSSASGYIGINLYFSSDNSTSTYTSGNSIINGNLGIGTLNPTSKLHISNKSSLSGLGGAYISVIQKQPNTTATGDGGLSVEYSLTAASASNELVNDAANIRSNNYLTGGGVVQYQRVLKLSSGSSIGSTTTNLDMIRIEPGGSSGIATNAYGLNIISLPGTNRWGIYDQSGSKWYTNGKLGIGDVTPNAKLSVVGNAAIGFASNQEAPTNGMIVNGNVGIGTPFPSGKLDVRDGSIFLTDVDVVHGMSGSYLENNYGILEPISEIAGGLNIYGISDIDAVGLRLNGTIGSATPAVTTPAIMVNTNKKNGTTVQPLGAADIAFQLDNNCTPLMTVLGNGNVGIGTIIPDKLFTVKGIIHAQEVQVDVTGFADYVFKKEYKLKPLSEIHSFISENGHLPEIPSEDEVMKNGMNVAEMQVMLLKKIEELTLYAIEQQKRIESLEKTLKEM